MFEQILPIINQQDSLTRFEEIGHVFEPLRRIGIIIVLNKCLWIIRQYITPKIWTLMTKDGTQKMIAHIFHNFRNINISLYCKGPSFSQLLCSVIKKMYKARWLSLIRYKVIYYNIWLYYYNSWSNLHMRYMSV